MVDYRGKTYIGMLEEENEKLQARWEKLKEFVVKNKLRKILLKMEELEQE